MPEGIQVRPFTVGRNLDDNAGANANALQRSQVNSQVGPGDFGVSLQLLRYAFPHLIAKKYLRVLLPTAQIVSNP